MKAEMLINRFLMGRLCPQWAKHGALKPQRIIIGLLPAHLELPLDATHDLGRARQDEHAQISTDRQMINGAAELKHGIQIKRILNNRTVEGDDGNAIGVLCQ